MWQLPFYGQVPFYNIKCTTLVVTSMYSRTQLTHFMTWRKHNCRWEGCGETVKRKTLHCDKITWVLSALIIFCLLDLTFEVTVKYETAKESCISLSWLRIVWACTILAFKNVWSGHNFKKHKHSNYVQNKTDTHLTLHYMQPYVNIYIKKKVWKGWLHMDYWLPIAAISSEQNILRRTFIRVNKFAWRLTVTSDKKRTLSAGQSGVNATSIQK